MLRNDKLLNNEVSLWTRVEGKANQILGRKVSEIYLMNM